jgi:dTDP-4-dehydrorhamnose reductase
VNVLITGSNGQLGWELQRTVPQEISIHAYDLPDLDITRTDMLENLINRTKPDCIINTAAYTAVDKAEEETELAFNVNAVGAENVARIAASRGIRLVHLSTDFVFDGKVGRPYQPGDKAMPLSAYGISKLEGENRIAGTGVEYLIVRTSWLYSAHGHNFVKTMLGLMRQRPEIQVVCDQIGSPTWARGLAEFIWRMIDRKEIRGIYHWTDAGVASWYDLAVAIMEEGLQLHLLERSVTVNPIPASAYPTPARRPFYSVLDKTETWSTCNYTAPHWRINLKNMLEEYAA